MDNRKTGKFISQRRKELSLTQKQLAEKLNVTDKAISKWETGNGAPDIALLSILAKTLNVSVIEILDGEYSENVSEESQAEKIVIEALQKVKKTQVKTVLSVLTTLLILFTLINIGMYAYWGNRHKILYNVDTVFVHQREDNKNTFIIHVEFDKSTIMGTVPSFKELITMSVFSAYNNNGEYDNRANLYMNDFKDVKIVVI